MNELEKALEQLNIKYETNGKQYKIPTTKENLVELLKGYIAMTDYLQSKIDKARKIIDRYSRVVDYDDEVSIDVLYEIDDALKEDK